MSDDPHAEAAIIERGAPLEAARAAVVMIHGRGSNAASILPLAREFQTDSVAYLAPDAVGGTWYPYRFLEPVEKNEPYLSSALAAIERTVQTAVSANIPLERVMLLGFSQGACLALEYAARFPGLYGGVVAFSGGIIENGNRQREYVGSLTGTPVFIGCSDVDFHIPLERVKRSTQVMRSLGADVTERIYPGMGHTVNDDETTWVRQRLKELTR